MPSADDTRRARDLIMAHGWNATTYQILNPGIRFWFAPEGDAVVGYADHWGVRVVAGAPVCAPERLATVVERFEADAARAGKKVCYFGAEARLEALFHGNPRRSLVTLGAQPSWNPTGWAAILDRSASLRAQLNRARNKGVTVAEWSAERATNHPTLRRCLAEWLAGRSMPALHFLVEPETLGQLADRRVFVATRRESAKAESVVGFLVASPIPTRDGWLVEQIIRGRDAPNGTAELMIDAAMTVLAAAGARYVTLGLAPLSRRAGEGAVPFWLRLTLDWVRAHGRRFYNFGGLDRFKAKFQPDRWEPIYAVAPSRRFSPRMLYAIAGVFSAGRPVGLVTRALAMAVRDEVGWLFHRRRP